MRGASGPAGRICRLSRIIKQLKVLVREQFVSVSVAVARFLERSQAGDEIERRIIAASGLRSAQATKLRVDETEGCEYGGHFKQGLG